MTKSLTASDVPVPEVALACGAFTRDEWQPMATASSRAKNANSGTASRFGRMASSPTTAELMTAPAPLGSLRVYPWTVSIGTSPLAANRPGASATCSSSLPTRLTSGLYALVDERNTIVAPIGLYQNDVEDWPNS